MQQLQIFSELHIRTPSIANASTRRMESRMGPDATRRKNFNWKNDLGKIKLSVGRSAIFELTDSKVPQVDWHFDAEVEMRPTLATWRYYALVAWTVEIKKTETMKSIHVSSWNDEWSWCQNLHSKDLFCLHLMNLSYAWTIHSNLASWVKSQTMAC